MEDKTIWFLVVIVIAILSLAGLVLILNKVGLVSVSANLNVLQLITGLFS